jgi:hypothetical protein
LLLDGELYLILSWEKMGYTGAITGPQMQQVPEKPLPKMQSKDQERTEETGSWEEKPWRGYQ